MTAITLPVSSFDDFDIWEKTPIHTHIDILTLSVCLYRLINSNKLKQKNPGVVEYPMSITDSRLCDFVTDLDYAQANKISEFYKKKFTWYAIKGVKLTQYRQDLLTFLNSEFKNQDRSGYSYLPKFIGLAHNLPFMYEYDVKLEKISGGINRRLNGKSRVYGSKKLKFAGTVVNKKRNYVTNEYWFTDEAEDLVMIPVHTDNPLLNLFEQIAKKNSINISGRFALRTKDDVEYLTPGKWQVDL